MEFNKHPELVGKHALLSPSKYHWLNYDDEKLKQVYLNQEAVKRGTELHEYAAQAIRLGIKQQNTKQTLNMYINDAIGFKMTPEQPLKYSGICFGTADAISFKETKRKLRIHDLKTGETPAHMEQLLIYAALFCLEYDYKPVDLDIELRIYQFDDKTIFIPTVEDLAPVISRIKSSCKLITNLQTEV